MAKIGTEQFDYQNNFRKQKRLRKLKIFSKFVSSMKQQFSVEQSTFEDLVKGTTGKLSFFNIYENLERKKTLSQKD